MDTTFDGGHRSHARRGVLLLIVLSMLTLFMMLGTAYLVVATRAKETARAFSRLALQSDARRVQPADMLDRVMMTVVAGGTNVVLRWPGDTFATGSNNYPGNPIGSGTTFPFESLLADKYGVGKMSIKLWNNGSSSTAQVATTITGTAFPAQLQSNQGVTASVATIAGLPLLEIPDFRTYDLSLGGTASPQAPDTAAWQDLPGRVITLLGAGRAATSHRILKATYLGQDNQSKAYRYRLVVDNTARATPFALPANASTAGCAAVINGREFIGDAAVQTDLHEPWDGFDDRNPFLARVEPQSADNSTSPTVAGSKVFKPSYVTVASGSTAMTNLDAAGSWLPAQLAAYGVSPVADNDNDGFNDGFFLDFGLPRTTDAEGNTLRLDASVLVVDLDGRFNVNAHGSLMELTYSGSHAFWPNPPGNATPTQLQRMGTPKEAIPMGLGFGPAEINPRALFDLANSKNGNGYGKNRKQQNENPALQIITGIDWTLIANSNNGVGGVRPGNSGSRFSSGAPTPRLPSCEGRYGQPPQGATLPSSVPTFSTTAQIGDKNVANYPFVRSGQPFTDDTISQVNDRKVDAATLQGSPKTNYGIPPLWWDGDPAFDWQPDPNGQKPAYRGVYNSPPDLHGRMKFTTGTANTRGTGATKSVVPGLVFTKAEWKAQASAGNPALAEVETTDDPYEIPLSARAPRNGWLSNTGTSLTSANPFTSGELEKLLRPYDLDAARLPSRLEAMLGSLSEESRLRLTTASWDTTAVTGEAGRRITGWLAGIAKGADIGGTGTLLKQTLGGELARGERFDLNRALSGIQPAGYTANDPYYVQRQAWCKDLFILTLALDPTADTATRERYAQWVVNACDFRDGDSTMTPFECDLEPEDGWDADGDATTVENGGNRRLVWGTERPEIVISEVSAWEDDQNQAELFVMLHRPWNALAYATDDNSIAAEPCDVNLDTEGAKPTNRIELARKSEKAAIDTTDASVKPIWRLRIVDDATGQTVYARFDVAASAAGLGGDELGVQSLTPATTPKMAADSWLMLQGTNTQGNTITATGTTTLKDFKVPGMPGQVGTNRDATIYLERLTDATATVTAAIWQADPEMTHPKDLKAPLYRVVDKVKVTVVNRSTGGGVIPPPPQQKASRLAVGPTAFWRNQSGDFSPDVGNRLTFEPLSVPNGTSGTNAPAWFHWPNRPFVSAAELTFVPGDRIFDKGPWQLLENYTRLDATTNHLPTMLLFDAVHVPTRFAGIHTTVPAAKAGNLWTHAGISNVTTPVNHLSAYREPARVNLNTVTANDVWDAVVAGPLVTKANGNQASYPAPVKKRAMTQGAQANEVADFVSGQPARSMAQLLALDKNPALDPTLPATQANAANRPKPVTDDYKNQEAGLKDSIDLNPVHGLYTATRLANTTTTRSHLFGVWITLREMVEGDPDSVRTHRAFYIVDRSIPVAFEPGKPHNVRDAVVLRRIIE